MTSTTKRIKSGTDFGASDHLLIQACWVSFLLILFLPLLGPAQTKDPIRHYVPYILHVPIKNPDGTIATCIDGWGRSVSSNFQPLYDTLISVVNPTSESGDVMFRFFQQDGTVALWKDQTDHQTHRLEAGHSLAATLIEGNGFSGPPQDFVGYGIIETPPGFRLFVMLGGGGCYPEHWNRFSASVPIWPNLTPKSIWTSPYVIPRFEDIQHSGPNSYRSGLVITNFDEHTASFRITYTVGNFYPNAGSLYTVTAEVDAGKSVSFDLYEQLIRQAGYPTPPDPRNNSEGWIRVEASVPVRAIPYVLISNRDYSEFSTGEDGIPEP